MQLDAKTESFNTVVDKYLLNESSEFNASIETDMNEVDSINHRIISLIRSRNYILSGLNRKVKDYLTVRRYLGYSAREIIEGYENEGFNSQVVRNAVKNTRKLFFDDNEEKFRDFVCTDITFDCVDCGDIIIKFEDSHGNVIGFDFSDDSVRSEYLYEHEFIGGYVYFKVNIGKECRHVAKSFDINKIRSAVRSYVIDGEEVEPMRYKESLMDDIQSTFKAFEATLQ